MGPTSRSARRETAGSCMSRCVSARPLLRGERIGELVTGIEPGLPDAQQLPVTPMHTGRRPGAVLVLVNADLDPQYLMSSRGVCGSSSFFQSWSV